MTAAAENIGQNSAAIRPASMANPVRIILRGKIPAGIINARIDMPARRKAEGMIIGATSRLGKNIAVRHSIIIRTMAIRRRVPFTIRGMVPVITIIIAVLIIGSGIHGEAAITVLSVINITETGFLTVCWDIICGER